jgi:hypothetical protein
MRTLNIAPKLFFIFTLAFYAGCTGSSSNPILPFGPAPCTRFGPARVDIIPITALVPAPDSDRNATINAYVCLLDAFDSQIKSPAVFRFELFELLQRSTNPKGKRLVLWPDIDLTDPAVNNDHWQDFLRAYLFSLPIQQRPDSSILQVTCLSPSGKRLTADFLLRPKP